MKAKRSVMVSVVIAAAIVMILMTLTVQEVHADETAETVVDGVKYTLNDDGTATVSGYNTALPYEVVIPTSVTYEGANYRVTSIGTYAFRTSLSLKSITIPMNVTSIGIGAFDNSGLESISFDEGSKLEEIRNYAFTKCKNLNSITIPAGVTSIGEYAFDHSGLKSVTFELGSKIEMIQVDAFAECKNLKSITIPAGVTSIDEYAFENAGLESVTFEPGSKLEKIYRRSFNGCSSLKSIIIPAGVISIGENAFEDSGLGSVTFEPESKLEKIEDYAFYTISFLSMHYIGTKESFDRVEKGNSWIVNTSSIHYVTGDPTITPATPKADGSIAYACSEDGCDWTYEIPINSPKSFKLSANKFTYNGKSKEPAVTVGDGFKTLTAGTDYDVTYASGRKAVGSYKVTVKLKGNYSGSKSISFKILPKKASIRSAKPGKKKIKVTMSKKVKSTGGKYYKIQYRVKGTKKWKTTKTSKQALTISKLKKGKRYQIRVCAYKDVKGTRYTGAWSKVKTTGKVK